MVLHSALYFVVIHEYCAKYAFHEYGEQYA